MLAIWTPSLIGVTGMHVPDPVHKQRIDHGLDYIAYPYSIVVTMIMDTYEQNLIFYSGALYVCVRERRGEERRERRERERVRERERRERGVFTLLILAYISSSKTPLLVAVEDLEVGGRFSDSLSSCVHSQQANVQWM